MKFTTKFVAALTLASMTIAAQTSRAEEEVELFPSQKLMQFTNDRDPGLGTIEILTNGQGAMEGLRYTRTTDAATRGVRAEFSLDQVRAGAALESQQGINALVFKGAIDAAKGGKVTFTYVANGMTGSYKSCEATLRRAGNEWVLIHTNGQRIQNAKITTWSLGISNLEGLCN